MTGAVKMKTTVTLRAAAKGSSHSRTDVSIRDVSATVDEPEARGGTNAGPAPTETALAALAGCTNVIANKVAHKMRVDLGRLEIDITCSFDRRGVTFAEEIDVPFVDLTQTIIAHGSLSEEALAAVGVDVAKYCPLSKLFESAGTKLTTTWRKP
ncbi:MAG: OsmC family protein [Pseudomonadota bacterium]